MNARELTEPAPTPMPTAQPRFVQGNYGQYTKLVDSNATEGNELTIFTIYIENLDYFIDVAGSGLVVTDSDDVVVTQSQSKTGTATVRRFPGDDAPFTRRNVPKMIMKNRQVRHGAALPGRRFTLNDGTELRTFTYQGELAALHAMLVGNLKMEVKFTHYNGAWEIIKPAAAEG